MRRWGRITAWAGPLRALPAVALLLPFAAVHAESSWRWMAAIADSQPHINRQPCDAHRCAGNLGFAFRLGHEFSRKWALELSAMRWFDIAVDDGHPLAQSVSADSLRLRHAGSLAVHAVRYFRFARNFSLLARAGAHAWRLETETHFLDGAATTSISGDIGGVSALLGVGAQYDWRIGGDSVIGLRLDGDRYRMAGEADALHAVVVADWAATLGAVWKF